MFLWTQEMSVGVESLDEEHRHLFTQVNKLIDRLKSENPFEDMVSFHQLLDDIMNYNAYHIKNEEEYMHKFDCVDEKHIAAHAWYVEQTKTLFGQASHAVRTQTDDAHQACEEFALFAGNWHTKHIVYQDQSYRECFNEHGLH